MRLIYRWGLGVGRRGRLAMLDRLWTCRHTRQARHPVIFRPSAFDGVDDLGRALGDVFKMCETTTEESTTTPGSLDPWDAPVTAMP
jgi:hypothetical protein